MYKKANLYADIFLILEIETRWLKQKKQKHLRTLVSCLAEKKNIVFHVIY